LLKISNKKKNIGNDKIIEYREEKERVYYNI
jgi:hypothetical protein